SPFRTRYREDLVRRREIIAANAWLDLNSHKRGLPRDWGNDSACCTSDSAQSNLEQRQTRSFRRMGLDPIAFSLTGLYLGAWFLTSGIAHRLDRTVSCSASNSGRTYRTLERRGHIRPPDKLSGHRKFVRANFSVLARAPFALASRCRGRRPNCITVRIGPMGNWTLPCTLYSTQRLWCRRFVRSPPSMVVLHRTDIFIRS